MPKEKKQTQTQEYLAMGFELMPSGRLNHHKWYGRKYGHASSKDVSWNKVLGHHICCNSKKEYCHKTGCVNRKELTGPDDLSDLKDL